MRRTYSLALIGSLLALASSVKIQDDMEDTANTVPTPGNTPWPTPAPSQNPPPPDPVVFDDAALASYTYSPTPTPTKFTDPPTPAPTNPPAVAGQGATDTFAAVTIPTFSSLDYFVTSPGCLLTGASSYKATAVLLTKFDGAEEECASMCIKKKSCGGYQLEKNVKTKWSNCFLYKNLNNDGSVKEAVTKSIKQDSRRTKWVCGIKEEPKATCNRDLALGRFPCANHQQFDSTKGDTVCTALRCTAAECCKSCTKDHATTYAPSKGACLVSECEVGYVKNQAGTACQLADIFTDNFCPANYVHNPGKSFIPMQCNNTNTAGICELAGLEAFVFCSSVAGQAAGCCGVEQGRDNKYRAGTCPMQENAGSDACQKVSKACATDADCKNGEQCNVNFCEVKVIPQWSAQAATPTPAPTEKMGREQYQIKSNCNFKDFNQIGKRVYQGTDSPVSYLIGSINRCVRFCDNTVGCYGFVLSQDRKQCTITGQTGGGDLATEQKFGFWCGSKHNDWRPKCGQHICSPGKTKKSDWARDTECTNTFGTGGDFHDCDVTCCEDEAPPQILTAGCKNEPGSDGGDGCDDALKMMKLTITAGAPSFTKIKDIDAPNNEVETLVANNDLSKVLVASGNNVVLIDTGSGSVTLTMTGHTKAVVALDVDWTENKAVSASKDGSIRFWDLTNGNQTKQISGAHKTGQQRDKVAEVTAVMFDPTRNIMVSAGKDQHVRLWDLTTDEDESIGKHTGSTSGIYAMDADFKLMYAITGGYDRVLRLFKLDANIKLQKRIGWDKRYAHDAFIRSVKADFSKKLAVSGSWDNTAKIWDLENYRHLRTLTGHTSSVRAVDVNFDSEVVFTASWDKSVRMWNLRSGVHILTVAGVHEDMLRGIATNQKAVNSMTCAAWKCDCQTLADYYGVDMVKGFGKTPAHARQWFMEQECQASHKACDKYSLDACSMHYCYLTNTAVQECTDAAPTLAPTPRPTDSPTAAPTKKKYNMWFKNIPVVGPFLNMIYSMVVKIPIVGGIIKNTVGEKSKAQEIYEKEPGLFEGFDMLGSAILGGGSKMKENDKEVSFKQTSEGETEGDVEEEAEEKPQIDVFNKNQAEGFIDDLKNGLGF